MSLGQLLHGHPGPEAPDTPGLTLNRGRSYDLFAGLFFGGRRDRVFNRLAELSGAKPGDRVLDVGCGTGYFARRIAARVAPGGRVTGIDASAGMIAQARRTSPADCVFALGVAERLDFADGAFDVVTSSLMIHHLPEDLRAAALAEMLRVLRPGGRLLVADFRPPRGRVGRRALKTLAGPGMLDNPIHALEPAVRATGFTHVDAGELSPWITYVRGVRE